MLLHVGRGVEKVLEEREIHVRASMFEEHAEVDFGNVADGVDVSAASVVSVSLSARHRELTSARGFDE